MSSVVTILLLVIIFAIAVFLIYYYFEKTKEQRLKRIKKENTLSPKDEAYNKVKSAQRITKMMKRRGAEDKNADQIVNKAEKALKSGKTSKAKELADKAKERASKDSGSVKGKDDMSSKKTYTVDELDEVEFEETKEAKKKREELEFQKS